jgi:hypothetical protein
VVTVTRLLYGCCCQIAGTQRSFADAAARGTTTERGRACACPGPLRASPVLEKLFRAGVRHIDHGWLKVPSFANKASMDSITAKYHWHVKTTMLWLRSVLSSTTNHRIGRNKEGVTKGGPRITRMGHAQTSTGERRVPPWQLRCEICHPIRNSDAAARSTSVVTNVTAW